MSTYCLALVLLLLQVFRVLPSRVLAQVLQVLQVLLLLQALRPLRVLPSRVLALIECNPST
jgi:hypothetical protein